MGSYEEFSMALKKLDAATERLQECLGQASDDTLSYPGIVDDVWTLMIVKKHLEPHGFANFVRRVYKYLDKDTIREDWNTEKKILRLLSNTVGFLTASQITDYIGGDLNYNLAILYDMRGKKLINYFPPLRSHTRSEGEWSYSDPTRFENDRNDDYFYWGGRVVPPDWKR